MALFAGELIPWIMLAFVDEDGHPLIGGKLYSWAAGTSDPLETYTDADLLVPHTNPIILDSSGRPESPIYLSATGYKFRLDTADDTTVFTIDNVETVGAAFAANLGLVLSSGSKNTVSGYAVLPSDRLITVDSTGGPSPAVVVLLPAADATQPITVKNSGSVPVMITASGTDTIDANAPTFELPAATAFNMPTVTLVPDGVSAYWITSSHGL